MMQTARVRTTMLHLATLAVLAAVAGGAACSMQSLDDGDSDIPVSLLQVGSKLKLSSDHLTNAGRSCMTDYGPGLHLVKLEKIGRQFLLFVPQELAESSSGVPLVMAFHGFSDSPWYTNKATGISKLLERYGWLGIFPFGFNSFKTNGMAGVGACCPPGCDDDCCKNGLNLNKKDATACGWHDQHEALDMNLTESLVEWAGKHTCTDVSKIFATGFSNGAHFSNKLACKKAHLFKAVAPISGDIDLPNCNPSKPISYLSTCGSLDDEAKCQYNFENTAKHWSKLNNCTGVGENGAPVVLEMSATTKCTQWSKCAGGTSVESCKTEGLGHDPSGHLRPDGTSFLRPGSDLDFPEYMFQKFSLLVNHTMLFDGHPNELELALKESTWPPPKHDDHMQLRKPTYTRGEASHMD